MDHDMRGKTIDVYLEQYHTIYNSVCYKMCDPITAQDVLQDAFIKIQVTKETNLPSNDQLIRPWLKKVVRNTMNDTLRKRKIKSTHTTSESQIDTFKNEYSAEEMALRNIERFVIEQYIFSLKPAYRDVLILRVYEGYTLNEIADVMDLNLNTVRSRYNRGKDKLRDKLNSQKP